MALSIALTHGSRNDILVIDGAPDDQLAAGEVGRAVARLCDRERGLGADGVYFVADGGDGSAQAWFFNPDGSPALLCGNGMRGAGRLLLDRHQAESFVLRTGPYAFTVRDAGATAHGVRQVAVELPAADFAPRERIVNGVPWPFVDEPLPALHPSRRVTALAVPNSHLVGVVAAYDEAELVAAGRRIAATPESFPVGANLSFVLPLGAAEVFVRTYERGAGLTPSCGSGNVASRAVLSRLGLASPGEPVLLRNAGGTARSWLAPVPVLEGNATLAGRAEVDTVALLADAEGAEDTEDAEGAEGWRVAGERESYPAEESAFAALSAENVKALREAGIAG